MKITNKLSSIMGSIIIAIAITLFLPSAVQAKGHGSHGSKGHSSCSKGKSSHGSWKKNKHKGKSSHGSHGSWKKNKHKGKSSHGSHGSWSRVKHKSKGSHGSHGSYGKGSHGSHGSYGKGSHGSHGSYGKGSHGSHGSYGKDSRGSCGSYGKGSQGSCGSWGNTTSKCSTYKTLAYRYLNAYYKCYNYRYYQYYVYYMNKYNQCISTPPTNTSCNQYKVLADKYLNAYRRCHNYTYYRYYCYYKKLYEKCQAATPPPVKKGNVCSTVYEDENENDKQDSNEKGTSGIKITLIDINGDSYTTTTDNKGNYCFKNIPEGKASVTLDLNSLPQDADHTVGYVMDDVTVVGCKTICAPKDGYVMPAPVLLGKACGRVILDGKGIKDVTVTIKDINGQEHNGTTDKCGNYCISGIPEGDANVTVDETTLPANIEQTGGENPNPVTIIGDKKVNAGVDCYNTIKSGSVVGFVYIDYNGDATFGGRDIPVIGVQITVTVGVEEFTTVTGADGKYKLDDVPAGEAEIKVNEVFIKDKFGGVITLSEGFNPSQITVVAGETVDAGNDGFCIAKY